MGTLPTWLKITATVLIVAVVALALAKAIEIFNETVPEHARAPAIEARFAPQLERLRELATRHGPEECEVLGSPEDLAKPDSPLRLWQQRAREVEEALSDPAILGAAVFFTCDNQRIGLRVKSYDRPAGSWTRSKVLPAKRWPTVSLWHAGTDRWVVYEDRIPRGDGPVTEIQLTLELDSLSP